MDTRIIYIRGLWSHDIATAWIRNKLEDYISIPVELFDYHDILVDNIDTGTYLSRVVEKFCDLYPFSNVNFIIIGHSHGGALATILVERLNIDKTVLINPAFRPWGVFRRVPNEMKRFSKKFGIGPGYNPHFIVKYNGEVEERTLYFMKNFKFPRDFSRVYGTGTEALKGLRNFRSNLLMIQSLKDEFVSTKASLSFFNQVCALPNYERYSRDLMLISNGEHAILEENHEYPKVLKKIAQFSRR